MLYLLLRFRSVALLACNHTELPGMPAESRGLPELRTPMDADMAENSSASPSTTALLIRRVRVLRRAVRECWCACSCCSLYRSRWCCPARIPHSSSTVQLRRTYRPEHVIKSVASPRQ